MNILNSNHPQKRSAISYLVIAALALLFVKVNILLNNPFFVGDSGVRMDGAGKIIVQVENRPWLPFLQMHIWSFYKLGMPYWAFKFIPAFYFFIAVLMLGLLTYRMLGENRHGLIFSLFLMLCFSCHRSIAFLSVNLYQEILEIAFLYLLLYLGMLDLKKRYFLLAIGSIALLTRDSFGIYLLVLSFLNLRKIISDKKYFFSFTFLWTIPVCWHGAMLFRRLLASGRWPRWPLEWPLMINRLPGALNHVRTLRSLVSSLASNRILLFTAGLMVVFVSMALYSIVKRRKGICFGDSQRKFMIFSVSSLAVMYALVLIFDPMQYSYGNPRLSIRG
jgi:hypothetical protein